jgi:hypothetical protein
MKGVEMMLGSMIGMKPEEMKKAVTDTLELVRSAANDMAEIKQRIISIEAKLEGRELLNGGRSIATDCNDSIHN